MWSPTGLGTVTVWASQPLLFPLRGLSPRTGQGLRWLVRSRGLLSGAARPLLCGC